MRGHLEKSLQSIWLPGGVVNSSILKGADELVRYKSNTEVGGWKEIRNRTKTVMVIIKVST